MKSHVPLVRNWRRRGECVKIAATVRLPGISQLPVRCDIEYRRFEGMQGLTLGECSGSDPGSFEALTVCLELT